MQFQEGVFNGYNPNHVKWLRRRTHLPRLWPGIYLRNGSRLATLLVRGVATPACLAGNGRGVLLPDLP